MTQLEKIEKLFKDNGGTITNLMLANEGLIHTGRNRIREYEKKLNGKAIVFIKGATFMDNSWQIRDIPIPFATIEPNGQVVFA